MVASFSSHIFPTVPVTDTFITHMATLIFGRQCSMAQLHAALVSRLPLDECFSLKGKQRQRFGDMGLIELRKTNNFQPQSHF